jgi:hypothetical protein
MNWAQGRATIEAQLSEGSLERVPVGLDLAWSLIRQAVNHLSTGRAAAESDTEGAEALVYDAARKALAAVLAAQGLRATSRGGHLALYEAVRAQVDPPLGPVLRPFERLRRRRNSQEYPDHDEPSLEAVDVREDADAAGHIVDMAERLIPELPLFH